MFMLHSTIIFWIMHYGTHIIWPHHICLVNMYFVKIVSPFLYDIVFEDGDVVVSVWTRMFMPESNGVHQLVQNPFRNY